jgi:hypothetical protein
MVQLLTSIPISGTVEERQFSPSARANTWVRFDRTDGSEWVGVFGAGEMSSFNAVVPFPDDNGATILVVAGGQGYVVDRESGDLLRKAPWETAYSAVPAPGRDFVLVADSIRAWAVYRDVEEYVRRVEPAWYAIDESDRAIRLALDGLVLYKPEREAIPLAVWEMDGWYAGRISFDALIFERGERLADDWDAIAGSTERGGYPPPAR